MTTFDLLRLEFI